MDPNYQVVVNGEMVLDVRGWLRDNSLDSSVFVYEWVSVPSYPQFPLPDVRVSTTAVWFEVGDGKWVAGVKHHTTVSLEQDGVQTPVAFNDVVPVFWLDSESHAEIVARTVLGDQPLCRTNPLGIDEGCRFFFSVEKGSAQYPNDPNPGILQPTEIGSVEGEARAESVCDRVMRERYNGNRSQRNAAMADCVANTTNALTLGTIGSAACLAIPPIAWVCAAIVIIGSMAYYSACGRSAYSSYMARQSDYFVEYLLCCNAQGDCGLGIDQ